MSHMTVSILCFQIFTIINSRIILSHVRNADTIYINSELIVSAASGNIICKIWSIYKSILHEMALKYISFDG